MAGGERPDSQKYTRFYLCIVGFDPDDFSLLRLTVRACFRRGGWLGKAWTDLDVVTGDVVLPFHGENHLWG